MLLKIICELPVKDTAIRVGKIAHSKEHVLFFQRTRTQSAYNSLQFQGSSTLFWTVQALCSHVYVPYPHTDM